MRNITRAIKRHVALHKVAYAYGLVAVIIMGPLLLPGYILTLDMIWLPEITLPAQATNTALLYIVLGALDVMLPSDFIQKIVLLLILWAIGYGTHRLLALIHRLVFGKDIHAVAAFAAGTLAMINPFTYARFMEGHWQILIGYAALSWVVWRLLVLVRNPTVKNTVLWTITLIILTMGGSTHMFFMGVLGCAAVIAATTNRSRLKRALLSITIASIIVTLANLSWIIPAIQSDNSMFTKMETFDYRHNATFRTVGHDWLPPELNVLTLHGYWGENQGRFVVAQDSNPLWWLLYLAIAVIAVCGAVVLYRNNKRVFWALLCLITLAWLLSLGSYTTVGGAIHRWLIDNVLFFSGYREPQKFVALLTGCIALLFGIGAHQVITRFRSADKSYNALIYAGFIALPMLYTPYLLWGTMGQLRTTDYPPGWYSLQRQFAQEPDDFNVVFLPWHHYIDFDPVGRTIANPAQRFFTATTVIQNEDPAIGLIHLGQRTREANAVQRYLIEQDDNAHASKQLAEHAIKYIMIAKIADWQEYRYVRDIPGLELVEENDDVLLYRNTDYHHE